MHTLEAFYVRAVCFLRVPLGGLQGDPTGAQGHASWYKIVFPEEKQKSTAGLAPGAGHMGNFNFILYVFLY